MTCEEFRTHINAVIDNEALAFSQDHEAHRASCLACADYATQIRAMHALLREIPAEPAPPSLIRSLRNIPANVRRPETLKPEFLRAALLLLPPLGLLIVQKFLPDSTFIILQIAVILFGLVTWATSVLRPFFLASR